VAILGLGKISMGYDKALPEKKYVRTHARALNIHPGFILAGGCDPNKNKRSEFHLRYKKPAFSRPEDLLKKTRPEVVVIASPTSQHKNSLAVAIRQKDVRAVLCEKPLAEKVLESARMVKMCKKMRRRFYINFIRRADPGILEIRKKILNGKIQKPFKAVVWYCKGLLHNGCHFVDLLSFLFGPIRAASIIGKETSGPAMAGSPHCRFDFKGGSAIFIPANAKNFLHHTCEVLARNGRLRIEADGTIFWQAANSKPRNLRHRALDRNGEQIIGNMPKYQLGVAEQLYQALQGKKHSLCTGQEALKSQKWIEKVLRLES